MQKSQREILADCETVYIEGLKPSDMPVFEATIRAQRKTPDDDVLLRLGAAAQLMVEGNLKVLPAEGKTFEDANPLKDDAVEINDAVQEAREDAIVRTIVEGGETAYVVLGGAHDLSDNIERLAPGWGCRVVTPVEYPE